MKIYTIHTRLIAINKDGEETLLDHFVQDFAYKVRENAYKALEDLKKAHMLESEYKPTRSDFTLVKEPTYEDGNKYELQFEIKEHYLSIFEDEKGL